MKIKREKVLNLILPLVSLTCLVTIWAIAASAINSEYILPSVKDTMENLVMLLFKSEFYKAFFSTLFRSFISFIISFSLAFILAYMTYKIKAVKRVISPIISVMRALPTIAIVLLLLFWTNSKIAPIIVTMLVVLPTSYTQFEGAFFILDTTVIEAGRVDGASEKQVFLHIELPLIMPTVLLSIGSGISLNFKLMVAAEVISQTAYSLGYLLNTSKVYFEIAKMLAIVTVTVIFGVLTEAVFNKLSKISGNWK